jgi:hypothetical protein
VDPIGLDPPLYEFKKNVKVYIYFAKKEVVSFVLGRRGRIDVRYSTEYYS